MQIKHQFVVYRATLLVPNTSLLFNKDQFLDLGFLWFISLQNVCRLRYSYTLANPLDDY